ncbi:MAG: ABC transporter permease, partial [Phycisphaerae bacterium]
EVMVPLLTEEFLAATGYSMFRVIVPLLIGVLVAGKCGAAVAADVGARRLTHQFDAMRSFGVNPAHYLYGSIVAALVVGVPLLTAVGCAANWYASLTAYLMTSEEATLAVFKRNFFATIWPAHRALPYGIGWVTFKGAASGAIIAAIAYALGSRHKASAVDVSRDVGLTIFWGSLAVLLLHSLCSFVEF